MTRHPRQPGWPWWPGAAPPEACTTAGVGTPSSAVPLHSAWQTIAATSPRGSFAPSGARLLFDGNHPCQLGGTVNRVSGANGRSS